MTESPEALESLLTHPGWLEFWSYVRQEWGPHGVQFQSQLDQALDLTDNNAAASQARQIRSAQKVIASLMDWPKEEVARRKRQEAKPDSSPSRRGGL